jgi:RND family efflux transporter MFP subunit
MIEIGRQGRRTIRPERLRHLGVPAGLSLLAIGAALGAAGCHSNGPGGDAASAQTAPPSSRLASVGGQTAVQMDESSLQLAGVTTAVAQLQDLHRTVQPTGQVAADDSSSVQVMARLPGRIVQALVSVGSPVRAGQLIATVDSTDLTQAEAAYETALAHVHLMQSQLEQQRRLAGYGMFSEQPVEDARRAAAAADAAVANDVEQIAVDRTALTNTQQLAQMGETTRKPVEDAQNAYAQAQSALEQAKVNLNSAQATLDRTRSLFNGGIYSKQQLEDAQTAHDNAVSSVQQDTVQENLAAEELARQKRIYKQNLNGASAIQQAQGKLQQDEHSYQNDLTSASLARRELVRASVVHKSGIPTSQAVQQAQDSYAEAQVALQGAESTLRLYGISPGQSLSQLSNGHVVIPVTAPLSGIVAARSMVSGQIVDTSTPLVKILNLNRVYVDSQVYEKDLPSVAPGDPVRLTVSAFPGKSFTGRVQSVGAEVNPDTRTITVRTVIPNPGWMLRPGMFATVLIGSQSGVRAVAVPANSILQEGESQIVYVQVAPREFEKRTVRSGPAIGDEAPVYSGLEPGDRVVVNGNVLIQNEQDKLEGEKGAAA